VTVTLEAPHVPSPSEPEAARSHSLAELVLRFRELGIVLALALVITVTAINNSNFVSATSLQQIVAGAAIIGLLAIGETMVIVTRNVDLSVGSVLGLSAYAAGVLFEHHPDIPIPLVMLVGLGIGLACGIVNGAIVTIARVPSLVVTLGTLYVFRGIDATWAGGHQVGAFSLPDSFNKIGFETFLGVPYLGWILILAVAVAAYWMRSFRTGRDLYAIGSNPEAARLAGVPVGSRVFLAFVLSGGIAGVTGVLWLSKYGSVDAIAGQGYEFQVIAAVVVGGVAIFGGSGTVVGAALGALLLNTIDSALVVVNFGGVTISSSWTSALAGALLLAAIAFDRLISIRVAPKLSTRRRRRG
jgi:rhamnose transport system permease protein